MNKNGWQAAQAVTVLNRLLAVLRYSLASYLRHARPWAPPGNGRLLDAVRRVAADHEGHARRIGRLILNRRGRVEPAGFPVRFAAYNDLALDYLARQLVAHERTIVEEVACGAAALDRDPEARQVAEHILTVEREHLRTLAELVSPAARDEATVPASRVAA
ncbi:MAG TPA: ferritin-like domain-containing protein [Gemmataceae bacterium]|jgi:bacterioferritin (cytochrome b1)